jgi:transcriptional regulator with XRE-family HTH domain
LKSSSSGPPDPLPGQPVGQRLASFRRRAGLTGHQLASAAGTTQSKISRLETGAVMPDPAAVRRIAEALGLPAGVVEQLVDEADREHNRMQDLRPGNSLIGRQVGIGDLERKGRVIRLFNPTTVPGLVQVDVYAKVVMTTAYELAAGSGQAPSESAMLEEVAAKVRRRETLAGRNSRVAVLMSEAALANMVARPATMLRQIEFIQETAAAGRFEVRIIPFGRLLPGPLASGFEVIDEKWLFIDLFNTAVSSQGREDIRQYVRVFDELWEVGTDEVGPILAEYARRYQSGIG